jgi:two-component system nitrate/nitrite response regulator NarL
MNEQYLIRIFLVDDHQVVLDGIRSRLQEESHIEVVGQALNGKEAIDLAHKLRPDVILMDVSMPIMGGLEATRHFKAELPEVRVLVLSMHDDQENFVRLMQEGASGYLLKDISSDELIRAIETVYQGSTYFSTDTSSTPPKNLPSSQFKAASLQRSTLTSREQMVLKQIAEGQCNKKIASTLKISVRTVETHRQNIKNKLQIHTAAGLARYAIEHKLVS